VKRLTEEIQAYRKFLFSKHPNYLKEFDASETPTVVNPCSILLPASPKESPVVRERLPVYAKSDHPKVSYEIQALLAEGTVFGFLQKPNGDFVPFQDLQIHGGNLTCTHNGEKDLAASRVVQTVTKASNRRQWLEFLRFKKAGAEDITKFKTYVEHQHNLRLP
jgi:hypothetical protein